MSLAPHIKRGLRVVFVGGVILLILGSIPNSADPMGVVFFIFCVQTSDTP